MLRVFQLLITLIPFFSAAHGAEVTVAVAANFAVSDVSVCETNRGT